MELPHYNEGGYSHIFALTIQTFCIILSHPQHVIICGTFGCVKEGVLVLWGLDFFLGVLLNKGSELCHELSA